MVDTYEYSGTQKDDIIIQIASMDDNCDVTPPVDTNTGTESTGSTNTGTSDSGSGDIASGSLMDTGTTSTGSEYPT